MRVCGNFNDEDAADSQRQLSTLTLSTLSLLSGYSFKFNCIDFVMKMTGRIPSSFLSHNNQDEAIDTFLLQQIHLYVAQKKSELTDSSVNEELFAASITAFLYLFMAVYVQTGRAVDQDDRLKPFEIDIRSDIPMGAGLGSSAAFSVVISAILCRYFSINHSAEDHGAIEKFAFLCEKIFHGSPSGIDNGVSLRGKYTYALLWIE